jgi:cysteine synthase
MNPNLRPSILDTIGNTPVVRLERLAPPGVHLFAKLEACNPGGSVKDRLALGVIEAAERSGDLRPGQTVIEATSGNTGIALAVVCARKGYPLVVTMAENFSVERRKLMRFLGARVVLTPAAEKGSGMLAKAVELAERHGWFLCRQFENEANAEAHSRTTAQEILRDFEGERLDWWVTGFGTGGTLKGVARVLRAQRPDTRIAACEPANSPLLGSGIAQPKEADGRPAGSHPLFRPHPMQGWSPDFISPLTEDAVVAGHVDRVLAVSGDDAMAACRELARCEGILSGISSGATLAGALEIARGAEPGTTILCMLPDTGERYLSTPLFDDIAVDMTAEEVALSQSTERFRFDVATPAAARSQENVAVDPRAVEYVQQTIENASQPVVLFALQWCEFCWSLRKLFAALDLPHGVVELDAPDFQQDGWGGAVRAALKARTGAATIPQVFVGGTWVGGCSETLEACNDGSLERMLTACGMRVDTNRIGDATRFLPGWVQPR